MIYAFSLGKFLNVSVYACVKDLTNIMSAYDATMPCRAKVGMPGGFLDASAYINVFTQV